MYFLVVNKVLPGAGKAGLAEAVPAHIQWTKNKIASGEIVQAGRWGAAGGMVILKADDPVKAEALLQGDPLIQSGLVSYEMDRFYPDVEI
ncbi:MAG: hypothetical protein HY751_11195 [Nitrospinae bacterium]|nr:hypothetical protein [Nitrospinota bacterium]